MMTTAMNGPGWHGAAAFGLGLALTLVLACCLTPRRWWRRPTAGNLTLAAAGTLAFGLLFASLLPAAAPGAPLSNATAAPMPVRITPAEPALRYRVVDDLNLRAAKATGAARLAILPAGTLVTPTGAIDGDWWQVRTRLRGRELEGWTSSLWLRRIDERALEPGVEH